jgi:cadmium resistance protein CadD (predicted permease)
VNAALIIVPLTAGAFIATNLDNLVLLVSLLARYRSNRFHVIAGYLSCAFILGLMGFIIAAAADLVPVQYLGLLGLVPITIGATGIIQMYNDPADVSDAADNARIAVRSAFTATLLIQLSNGADTVVTLGALFADSSPAANILIFLTLAAMAVAFAFVAIYAVQHPLLSRWIERYGPRVTPFILILVGFYILSNTATDMLPG